MTVTVEEDFREFVVARWGELEPVAHLVTLDAATARRVTTDALADLHGRWGQLLDDGAPGAAARRAVLSAAVAAAEKGTPRRAPRGADDADRGAAAPPDDLSPDEVLAALTAVVRAAAPWNVPSSRPAPPGGWTPTPSPTCSRCRPPPFATPTSPCAHACSRRTPRPGWPPAGSRRSGHWTATWRTPWTPCSSATTTLPTPLPSWASGTGRCAAARSSWAPARRWPRPRRRCGPPTPW